MSNVRQIGLAFKQYAVDHNDEFPGISASNALINSTSVFLSLTNGNYLVPGRIYLCPSSSKKTPGGFGGFTARNNSYACVVSNASGLHGLSESNSSDNPLIFDEGLVGAPGGVIGLTNATWSGAAAHKGDGGNIFYVGGQAAFRKKFDCGADGTNGFAIEP